jgi:hypothetical protein
MAFVSLDSSSCEVPCLILHSVVYRDITRQAKELYGLKHVEALKSGLAYLSRCNSGWFCHSGVVAACTAAMARCPAPAAGGCRAEQHMPEEEKGRGGWSGGVFGNF